MKNLNFVKQFLSLSIIVVLVMLLASCNKQEIEPVDQGLSSSHQEEVTDRKPRIRVTIVRGIDIDVDGIVLHCAAGGPICEIIITIELNAALGPDQYNGVLTVNPEQELIGHFDKASMSEEVQSNFANGLMEMPQDRYVDAEIMNPLGFDEAFLIEAGAYSYLETEEEYIVNFGKE